MLSTDIHSTAELISIALAAEREAIRRYSDLASEMYEYGNDEVGALFERMIDEEKEHERLLTEWAELEGLAINTNIGPIRWEDPGVATIYDAEAVDPDQSKPYKALAFAVHNEERAFRYYSYVAANSKDSDVRAYAEILAREELGHAALLRAQRRHAWHVQRSKHEAEPRIGPGTIYSIPDLLAAIVCIEECLADLIDAAANEYPDLKVLAANTRGMLSISEKALHEGDAPGVEIITTLKSIASWRTRKFSTTVDASTALRRLCMACDRSFSFYDSVVTSTQDESVMLMAQRLSTHALERISELRRLTASSCDCTDYNASP
ncbi:MAG: ferritin family protein [Gammaproteobacteria bacterium]|nr:ferritin family protein [Gammaproteobacteria bacterium]